uniref:Uncharacterized protein n=1 Tax=Sinocyclocheilus rhinocerous TaxID=307959 RepID=A0A673KRG3_9TELE
PVLGRHYDHYHRWHNRCLCPHLHHHPHDPLQGVQQRRLRQGDLGHRHALANQRCAIPGLYRHLGNVFCKRSMSVNGMLVQMANSNLDSEKTAFSSSEWILESTV